MSQELWSKVDDYFADLLIGPDAALDAALEASRTAGMPAIHVAPNQGKLLHLLARATRARSILEVGTLGGYSTIWLARALGEGGRLVTLEKDPRHAEVARLNIERAGLSSVVTIRLGPALESLDGLIREKPGPFDLTFIDADKPGNADYFDRAVTLSRPGSLIIVDNVVRKGKVIDPGIADDAVQGVRRFVALLAKDDRVKSTALQTVGDKGHDGLVFAVVNQVDTG